MCIFQPHLEFAFFLGMFTLFWIGQQLLYCVFHCIISPCHVFFFHFFFGKFTISKHFVYSFVLFFCLILYVSLYSFRFNRLLYSYINLLFSSRSLCWVTHLIPFFSVSFSLSLSVCLSLTLFCTTILKYDRIHEHFFHMPFFG